MNDYFHYASRKKRPAGLEFIFFARKTHSRLRYVCRKMKMLSENLKSLRRRRVTTTRYLDWNWCGAFMKSSRLEVDCFLVEFAGIREAVGGAHVYCTATAHGHRRRHILWRSSIVSRHYFLLNQHFLSFEHCSLLALLRSLFIFFLPLLGFMVFRVFILAAIGGTTGKLLEVNSQAILKIRANLAASQVQSLTQIWMKFHC